MMRPLRVARGVAAGFTLAEAAITIAIVAIVITMVLQGLQGAETSAAHTRYKKTAYELGVGMLGEISAGLYMEEIETGTTGSFADLDEPDFYWEIALGDDVLEAESGGGDERPFDNLAARREWEDDQDDDSEFDEDDEEAEEPFEKVKLRVTYPVLVADYPNTLVLERWIPWDQVYGPDEDEDQLQSGQSVTGPPNGNAQGNGSGNGEGG